MQRLIATVTLLLVLTTVQGADTKKTAAPKRSGPPAEPGLAELQIGDPAPNFSLPGIDGKNHTLTDYQQSRFLMVAFLCNHCPDSQGAEGRIKKLLEEMKGQSFALVAINPNNPEAVRIDELGYAKYNDSLEEMKKHAAEQQFTFPYLYDGETQAAAKAFGCLATPHVFLFDANRRLRYQGAFDDSRFGDPATVKATYARDALLALLGGQPVPVQTTRPHGCSTKWLSKKHTVTDTTAKYNSTPVEIESIDAAEVASLRTNSTRKLRLFNVWATWCAPCVAEFPELVRTSRQFSNREFELITISLDEPKTMAKAKAFLEKQGAAPPEKVQRSLKDEGRKTNAYLFTGASQESLMNILDPQWPGGIPHTVLVAPGGRVLWRHNGVVDGEQLRAKILDYMGRFYKP